MIAGPLGTEAEFEEINAVADAHGVQIVVDTVFNHTVDVTEQPDPPLVVLSGNSIAQESFPQFGPEHFHERCPRDQNAENSAQVCWLMNKLADLQTPMPSSEPARRSICKSSRRSAPTVFASSGSAAISGS